MRTVNKGRPGCGSERAVIYSEDVGLLDIARRIRWSFFYRSESDVGSGTSRGTARVRHEAKWCGPIDVAHRVTFYGVHSVNVW
jgi:hypothetical protein